MTTSRRRHLSTAGATWLLMAYGVLLAIVLLAPSAAAPSWLVTVTSRWAAGAGIPAALAAADRVELVLNVAAFVPLAFLARLRWPNTGWRDWTAAGFVAPLAVEVIQAVALDARSATHADVVANTLGALLGAVVAVPIARLGAGD